MAGCDITEMFPERFQKHKSLHWPNETLALDHTPNEMHGA